MKHSHLMYLCAAAFLITACADDPASPSRAADIRFNQSAADANGTYLVRFKGKGIPNGFEATVSKLGGEVIFAHGGAGVAAVAGLIPSAADQLASASGIAAVDADTYTVLDDRVVGVESFDGDVQSPAAPATSAFFGRQLWNLGVIRADQAWAAGYVGNASIKVGILDTGIDYLHPDLVNKVDLNLSRSFLSAAENARVPAGAHLVADLHYHGTHVASTVASNAWIASGVTVNTTLVGLKVCVPGTAPSFQATCPTSGTLAAILYAADNGIPVINMSLGGSFQRKEGSARGGHGPSFMATLNEIMSYVNRKGTLVVVSAGNDAIDMDNDGGAFKAYCDAVHVICVSATGPTAAGLFATSQFPRGVYLNIVNIDALASYSNFGGKVMVAAPGGNAAAVWQSCSGFTLHPALAGCRTRFYTSPTSWSGSIVGLAGTSMAAPHTAGLAALIAAHLGGGPAQIRDRIASKADDLGPAGWDPAYGYGRINVQGVFVP